MARQPSQLFLILLTFNLQCAFICLPTFSSLSKTIIAVGAILKIESDESVPDNTCPPPGFLISSENQVVMMVGYAYPPSAKGTCPMP
jgi:hypothetical protein